MTLVLSDQVRTAGVMRQLLNLTPNPALREIFLTCQRDEMKLDSPNQDLIQFLGLLISGSDEDRAKAQVVLDAVQVRITAAADAVRDEAAKAALPTLQSHLASPAATPPTTLDALVSATAVRDVALPMSSHPDAIAAAETLAQPLRHLNGLVNDTAPPAPAVPARLKAYQATDSALASTAQNIELTLIGPDGEPLPTETFTVIQALPNLGTDQPILGLKGAVMSVKDVPLVVNGGLGFVLPLSEPYLFDDNGNLPVLRMALRLPQAVVQYDDHYATAQRNAGAFVELYHLMNEGYIFLIELRVTRLDGSAPYENGHRFHLSLNRDRIMLDRQLKKDGETTYTSSNFDQRHLNALATVIERLEFAGFLGVVQ